MQRAYTDRHTLKGIKTIKDNYSNRKLPLIMFIDVCQCCRLLMFVCLSRFKAISLLSNLVNKESESDVVI